MRVISKSDPRIKPDSGRIKANEITELLDKTSQVNTLLLKIDSFISDLEEMEGKMSAMSSRFGGIDKQLEGIDKQLEGLWPRVNSLEEKINKFEQFMQDHKTMHSDMAKSASNKIADMSATHSEVLSIGNKVSSALSSITKKEASTSLLIDRLNREEAEPRTRKIFHEVQHGAQGRIKGVISTIVEE